MQHLTQWVYRLDLISSHKVVLRFSSHHRSAAPKTAARIDMQ